MTPTQGEHAQTALAHAAGLESFSESLPAYGFNPQPLKDAAETIRRLHAQVAGLTAATVAPKVALELPAGDTRTANVYWSEMRGDTLHLCISVDTPAQPAAPQGVAYAELPAAGFLCKSAHGAVAYIHDVAHQDGPATPIYNADQMRDFADRTNALRASNGQAPAGATAQEVDNLFSTLRYVLGIPSASGTIREHWQALLEKIASWPLVGADAVKSAASARARELATTAQAAPAAGAVAGPVTTVPLRELGVELRKAPYCLGGPQLWALHRNGSLIRYLDQFENDFVDSALLAAAPTPAAQADSVPQKETPDETLWQWYLANKDVEIPHSRAVALRVLQGAIRVFGNADSVLEDAALLHYALADGGNQSMNWQDVYDDWSGEGYFIDALRAAYKQDAARKQGGA